MAAGSISQISNITPPSLTNISRAGENAVSERSQSSALQLSDAEMRQVEKLKAVDRRVRAHEQAHQAVGGNLVTRGASYGYMTGPNGQRYAVSGEVQIDTSEVPNDPKATLQKANQIKRAALAPADPSSQDYKIAAQASQMAMQARTEIARQRYTDQPENPTGMNLNIGV